MWIPLLKSFSLPLGLSNTAVIHVISLLSFTASQYPVALCSDCAFFLLVLFQHRLDNLRFYKYSTTAVLCKTKGLCICQWHITEWCPTNLYYIKCAKDVKSTRYMNIISLWYKYIIIYGYWVTTQVSVGQQNLIHY